MNIPKVIRIFVVRGYKREIHKRFNINCIKGVFHWILESLRNHYTILTGFVYTRRSIDQSVTSYLKPTINIERLEVRKCIYWSVAFCTWSELNFYLLKRKGCPIMLKYDIPDKNYNFCGLRSPSSYDRVSTKCQ